MAFWGAILKPNQKKKVESPEGDILHLSQACLFEPKDGKNYVMAEVAGTSYSIACLEKGKKEHDSFDLFFDPKQCAFTNKGQSDVHLTGYFEPMDDEEDGEEEPVPAAKKTASPKAAAVSSPKVKESSPKVAAASSPKTAVTPKSAAAKAPAADESEGEDEEEEEEEESEEEEPAPVQGKRKGNESAAPPAKKVKSDATAAASPVDAYVKTVHAYLKANGKQNFGTLGGKCPKPKDTPKFKVLFEQHKDKFVVAGDVVSAK